MSYGDKDNLTATSSKGVKYDPDRWYETVNGNMMCKGKKFSAANAKEMQVRSVESRMLTNKVKKAVEAFSKQGADAPPALEVMKAVMLSQLAHEDLDGALKTAAIVAEFETPKLSRREVEQRTVEVSEMSVDDIDKELEEVNLRLVNEQDS
jgi:heme oxygenase